MNKYSKYALCLLIISVCGTILSYAMNEKILLCDIFVAINTIVSENGGLIMFEWLKKIFHRKPDPCDGCDMWLLTSGISCDTCIDGCNKQKVSEKELVDFMKYRGSLMDKE